MQEGSLEEEMVQKRMPHYILSSPSSRVNRRCSSAFVTRFVSHGLKQIPTSFHRMTQAEHVRVEQSGSLMKPVFLRKGTCFFVTSICGSSSQASRHVVR